MKELSVGILLGNIIIEINDNYGEKEISITDFSNIVNTIYGTQNLNCFTEYFKNAMLGDVQEKARVTISSESFNNIVMTYKPHRYYNIHFNKGDIKFELKDKEISDEMRKEYRKFLNIEDYKKIENATKKCIEGKAKNLKNITDYKI
jgi:hypothetical protein